jgi:hypothetical protein
MFEPLENWQLFSTIFRVTTTADNVPGSASGAKKIEIFPLDILTRSLE